jgi:hypothetical protein
MGRNGCTVATWILVRVHRYGAWRYRVKRFGRWQNMPAPEICCGFAASGLWPGIHQVGYVNGAQASGKVPTGFCWVRLKQFVIRPGKYSVIVQSGTVTVIGTVAGNGDISGGDVVENTGRRYTVAQVRVACLQLARIRVCRAPIFQPRQVIQNGIGIPLRGARFLIDERLNTGKLWGGKGSAAGAIEEVIYRLCEIAREASLICV